jgi:hypothetical protein
MSDINIVDIILIILGWLVILPPTLYWISEKISLVGVYHDLDGEKLKDKTVKIFCCNFHLSFVFIFCSSVVIRETFDGIELMDAFVLSLPMTLASLLTLRILSNPSEHIKPRLCSFHAEEKGSMIIDQHKERILSFFYSFMGASVLILLIIFSNNVLMDATLKLPNFDCEQYLIILLVLIVGLGLTTLIGEYVLKKFPPIETI